MRIKNFKSYISISVVIIISVIYASAHVYMKNKSEELINMYTNRESIIIQDRFGNIMSIEPNSDGYYAQYSKQYPDELIDFLLKKEDNYFYLHLGINPISSFRAFKNYLLGSDNLAHSTLTQQLVKVLLGNVDERTIDNKITESIYAISLEYFLPKDKIMEMYLDSVYLGNNIQGFFLASRYYFETLPESLSDEEILQLVTSIESPSTQNPFKDKNIEETIKFAKKLNLSNYKIFKKKN